MNHYLRFADEDEAITELTKYRALTEDEVVWVQASTEHALDVIGELYEVDGEGEDAKSTKLPGFHINLFLHGSDLSDELKQYEVFPETPLRVWA